MGVFTVIDSLIKYELYLPYSFEPFFPLVLRLFGRAKIRRSWSWNTSSKMSSARRIQVSVCFTSFINFLRVYVHSEEVEGYDQ